MKSTLIFLSVLTGVSLAQLPHCTKYSDCSHLSCDRLYAYHCKDNVCVCEPWCACSCPLGYSTKCLYTVCTCWDSNGLYAGKHCAQKSDCDSITCQHNETRHCKDGLCACQRYYGGEEIFSYNWYVETDGGQCMSCHLGGCNND